METKVEKLPKGKVKLKITVSAPEMVKHFNHAFDELSSTVKLPGFRPGKAPRAMAESSLGVTKISTHALDHAVQEAYEAALQQENIVPIAMPSVNVSKFPGYGLTEEEIEGDLEFVAEVDTFPEVSLEDYTKVKVETGKPEDLKKEDTEKILTHLQKQKSTLTDVDRSAKKGDFVEIDFEGFQKHVRIDKMCSKNHPVVLGEGTLIPGFEDQVAEMKKGEEKTFTIKFPKDYHAKDLAGQAAEFKVKLNVVKEIQLPALDDEFAKSFGRKDMADLTEAIEKDLKKELEQKYENELQAKVIEKVLPLMKVEIPESLAQQEVARMVEDHTAKLKSQGLNFEAYLKSMKKEPADFRRELMPQAEKNVKIGFLLGQIVKDQGFDADDKEAARKALDFLVKELTKK